MPQQQPVYGMPTNQNCNDDKSTNAHPQPATNETPYANGTVAADGVKVCSFFLLNAFSIKRKLFSCTATSSFICNLILCFCRILLLFFIFLSLFLFEKIANERKIRKDYLKRICKH